MLNAVRTAALESVAITFGFGTHDIVNGRQAGVPVGMWPKGLTNCDRITTGELRKHKMRMPSVFGAY